MPIPLVDAVRSECRVYSKDMRLRQHGFAIVAHGEDVIAQSESERRCRASAKISRSREVDTPDAASLRRGS